MHDSCAEVGEGALVFLLSLLLGCSVALGLNLALTPLVAAIPTEYRSGHDLD